MPSDFPVCKHCGHVFRYQTGLYNSAKGYINLQDTWSNAHTFGGEHTRVVTCPDCGNRCEVGYKCTMRPVSRKAKGGDAE